MNLYHYYDKRSGPFKSLTTLSNEEAFSVLEKIKADRPNSFSAQRDIDYVVKRSKCESIVREHVIKKGIAKVTLLQQLAVKYVSAKGQAKIL